MADEEDAGREDTPEDPEEESAAFEEVDPGHPGDGEDPFERLDAAGRDGDPFERLDDASGAEDPSGADASPEAWDAETPSDAGGEAATPEEDPFEGFGDAGEDPFAGSESVFAGAEGDDGVWERMDEEEDAAVQEVPGRRYVEVSKHSYCEQCEYFSRPPDIHCTNDGTEILEFTDMETVRVVNCPVVAERQALQDEG